MREGFSLFDLAGRSAGGRLPKAGLGMTKGVTTGRSEIRQGFGELSGEGGADARSRSLLCLALVGGLSAKM